MRGMKNARLKLNVRDILPTHWEELEDERVDLRDREITAESMAKAFFEEQDLISLHKLAIVCTLVSERSQSLALDYFEKTLNNMLEEALKDEDILTLSNLINSGFLNDEQKRLAKNTISFIEERRSKKTPFRKNDGASRREELDYPTFLRRRVKNTTHNQR